MKYSIGKDEAITKASTHAYNQCMRIVVDGKCTRYIDLYLRIYIYHPIVSKCFALTNN